jgi:hypothetical protein
VSWVPEPLESDAQVGSLLTFVGFIVLLTVIL